MAWGPRADGRALGSGCVCVCVCVPVCGSSCGAFAPSTQSSCLLAWLRGVRRPGSRAWLVLLSPVWGQPARVGVGLCSGHPPPPPLPSPEALTAACRGQAGCSAGFPVRRGLLGPGVPGPPVSSGGLWAGWGRYGLDVRPASTLEARGLGRTCLPYVVLPGGEARTLLVGVGLNTRTVSPGSVTEGLS